jgi:hypothetical protein
MNLTFAFTRNDDSESSNTLVVQYGSDFTGWTDVPVGAASTGPDANGVLVSVTENGAAPDTIVVTIPRSNAVAGKLFARVRAVP